MVVVFVTHNYPRHSGDLPGLFLHPLARALAARGVDVRVVAPSDRGLGGREVLDGIPVRRVRYAVPHRETLAYGGRMEEAVRSLGGLLRFRALVRALRAGARAEAGAASGPVLAHAHWWIPGGLSLPGELPGVVTLHGTDGRILARSGVARLVGRRVLRPARMVTAVSTELAAIAERASGRSDIASHVQPMPLESTGRPWTRGGRGAVVVARLTAQKRVELAILAVAKLAELGIPVPLTIIGDGPERPALEAAAASMPAAQVRFLGALPPAEVARLLGESDVMLFPAVAEGLGLAAIEALMAGVPVVACSDGGGVASAVTRFGGGIVTRPDPAALAAALAEASEPRVKEAARVAGARWREDLAPPRVAERFLTWYGEALGA